MTETASRRTAAISLAFISLGLIWGTNFVFMKWATQTISPAQVTFLRVVFGFVPVVIFAAVRGDLSRAHLRYAPHFAVMAVLATALYYFCFAAGTQRLPSGIAGALSGTIPLVAFIATSLLLRSEPVTAVALGGVLCGFAGVLLIARPWDATSGLDGVGVALMLLGSASVGVSFVYARRFLTPLAIPASALATYQMGIAAVLLVILTPKQGLTDITGDRRALLGLVLGLGLLGTGIAYLLYYLLIDRLGAVTASSVTFIPPVVALAIGWLFVGEAITVLDVVALGLVLCGVLLIRTGSTSR